MHRRPAQLHVNRVLVAPFDNQTGDPNLTSLGAMAADWIAEGLSRLSSIEVVDARTALATGKVVEAIPRIFRSGDRSQAMAEETGAGVLVMGNFYRDSGPAGAMLRFQA